MAKARRRGIGGGLAGLFLSLAVLYAMPAPAQETPDQFDAANAENRRHTEAQQQLRNQAHDLRNERTKALLHCQGAGSASAQTACSNNAEIDMRQRNLEFDNRVIQERNTHNQILKGLGVHRAP